jgi:hypothetical protein
MPDLMTEEPLWVQRMRARGYNIRVGTGDQPMSEIPDAMFPPPVHPVRRTFGRMLRAMQRTLGIKPYRNGRDASVP